MLSESKFADSQRLSQEEYLSEWQTARIINYYQTDDDEGLLAFAWRSVEQKLALGEQNDQAEAIGAGELFDRQMELFIRLALMRARGQKQQSCDVSARLIIRAANTDLAKQEPLEPFGWESRLSQSVQSLNCSLRIERYKVDKDGFADGAIYTNQIG